MRTSLALFLVATGLAAGLASPSDAAAQAVEAVGTRALGMGGAFVAVANDSSATWWNPAGLAAGPFLDVAIGRNTGGIDGVVPAARHGVSFVTAATPPFGLSYYRLHIADVRPLDPTAQDRADRQDRRAGVSVRSLSVSQFGATILQTLVPGIHVGTTVKYVRGIPRTAEVGGAEAALLSIPDLLDVAGDLEGGDAGGGLDLDAGVLAVVGPYRIGGLVRNIRQQALGDTRMPRQFRAGAAFDGEAVGMLPLTVAIDADLRAYPTGAGDRRVIALGAEHWLLARRVGVRGGARFNTVGYTDSALTAGASVAPRAGLYLDGHVVYGGSEGETGWGISARVSF